MTVKEPRQPTHRALSLRRDGRRTYWTRIGVAWPQNDGKGIYIRLDALPIGDEIVLREIGHDAADATDAPPTDAETIDPATGEILPPDTPQEGERTTRRRRGEEK